MASAFDKIKKAAAPAARKTEVRTATVNDGIREAVDKLIDAKAASKAIEAQIVECETTIIEEVRPQQDQLAIAGDFVKSLEVPGNKGTVLFSTTDRFSVPQDPEALAALQKLCGEKFGEFFGEKQTLSIKSAVLANEETLNKIAKACEKAGLVLGDIFDNTVKVVAKDNLDRKQYELGAKKLAEFRTMVKQNKPALKARA